MEKDVVQARGHLLEKPAIDSSHNDAISNSQPKGRKYHLVLSYLTV